MQTNPRLFEVLLALVTMFLERVAEHSAFQYAFQQAQLLEPSFEQEEIQHVTEIWAKTIDRQVREVLREPEEARIVVLMLNAQFHWLVNRQDGDAAGARPEHRRPSIRLQLLHDSPLPGT